MEGMGLKLTPVVVRHLLFRPSGQVWAYGLYFLDSQLLQTVLTEGIIHFQLPPLPHHQLIPPSSHAHPLCMPL